MATAANVVGARPARSEEDRFFLGSAIAMALVLVLGFSFQLSQGRSSFAAPLLVHAHAVVFFGWVVIYLAQTWLGTRGSRSLHRRLGWFATGWVAAMLVLGVWIMAMKAQTATTPPIFQPQHFLIANPITLLLFAGLTAAAIVNRRRRDWHKRLHLSAMAAITAPGFGRLLPMPLLVPYAYQWAALAALLFPVVGMVVDLRRRGRVHPAWWWGVGATIGSLLLAEAIVWSPVGDAIYAWVTAGTPGAVVAPLAFPPPPLP